MPGVYLMTVNLTAHDENILLSGEKKPSGDERLWLINRPTPLQREGMLMAAAKTTEDRADNDQRHKQETLWGETDDLGAGSPCSATMSIQSKAKTTVASSKATQIPFPPNPFALEPVGLLPSPDITVCWVASSLLGLILFTFMGLRKQQTRLFNKNSSTEINMQGQFSLDSKLHCKK